MEEERVKSVTSMKFLLKALADRADEVRVTHPGPAVEGARSPFHL